LFYKNKKTYRYLNLKTKTSLNPQLKIIIAILDKIILFEPIKWFLFKKNFSKKHFFTFL
jgi:hypothetical protein